MVIKKLRFALALVFGGVRALGGCHLAHWEFCFGHHLMNRPYFAMRTNSNAMVGVVGRRWNYEDEVQGLGTWRTRVLGRDAGLTRRNSPGQT